MQDLWGCLPPPPFHLWVNELGQVEKEMQIDCNRNQGLNRHVLSSVANQSVASSRHLCYHLDLCYKENCFRESVMCVCVFFCTSHKEKCSSTIRVIWISMQEPVLPWLSASAHETFIVTTDA